MAVVELRDEFDNNQGEFNNYDALDTGQRVAISHQRHVDIRSFDSETLTAPVTMLHFDRQILNDLNNVSMIDLEGSLVVSPGETWTQGTVDRIPTKNNWRGLTLNCTPGINSTLSTI